MNIDVTNLRKLAHDALDEAITKWVAGEAPTDSPSPDNMLQAVVDEPTAGAEFTPPERTTPEGKRVVRTKTSGDRVYLLDDTQNPKTRAWVTNEDILNKLGFTQADVIEVDDVEMMKYNMAPAVYKVDEPTNASS